MSKRKILVVDDEKMLTRMLKLSLEAMGDYEVLTINLPTEALGAALRFMPDLILLDVMMPEVDGGDVAAQLQECAELNTIPIIFLTAIVTKEEAPGSGVEIAGKTFLAKPIKTSELIVAINAKLASRDNHPPFDPLIR